MIDPTKPYRARNKIIKSIGTNNRNKNESGETGFLNVTVIHNVVNEPIKNAEVFIYELTISGTYNEEGIADLIAMHTTDENGKIPLVELPVINQNNIKKNAINNGQIQYIISVQAFGYYNAFVFGVPIYPNITTSYVIKLSHIDSKEPKFKFMFNPKLI